MWHGRQGAYRSPLLRPFCLPFLACPADNEAAAEAPQTTYNEAGVWHQGPAGGRVESPSWLGAARGSRAEHWAVHLPLS